MDGSTTIGRAEELRAELERHGEEVGRFWGADGEHRCRLVEAGGEALVYDLPPSGPALCLAVVGGSMGDLRGEAEAVVSDYARRAAEEERPLCRAVTRGEVARLGMPQRAAA